MVSGSPLAATSSIAAEPGLPTTSEGMEEEEEKEEEEIRDWTNEMSAEAQAHNISMFLSSSASDSGIMCMTFAFWRPVYPFQFTWNIDYVQVEKIFQINHTHCVGPAYLYVSLWSLLGNAF